MTSIYNGYYVAKALNMTINKKPTMKVYVAPGRSTKYQADYPGGTYEHMMQVGIVSRINQRFTGFRHGYGLPRSIIAHYREQATKLGHQPAY
jgi:hypothetical protein